MNKILLALICALHIYGIASAQTSFNGTVSGQSRSINGISLNADCNVSIFVKSTTGGLYLGSKTNSIQITSLQYRERNIPASSIPANVIAAWQRDIRLSLKWDLYKGGQQISAPHNYSSMPWFTIMGLAKNDYNKETDRKAFELYKSGAITIENVEVEVGGTWAMSSAVKDYFSQLSNQGKQATAAVPSGNPLQKSSPGLVIESSGSKSTSSTSTAKTTSSSSAGSNTASYTTRNSSSTQSSVSTQQRNAAIDNAISVVSSYHNQLVQERAQERQARLERQEAEMMARSEENLRKAKEIRRKLERSIARKELLTQYGNGTVPLSSRKVEGGEVFFFCSSYLPEMVEKDQGEIKVSGIFPIARYADGTWPFTKSLKEEIAKVNKVTTIYLSPVYTSYEEAKQELDDFVSKCEELELIIQPLAYKGKAKVNSDTDFWGNPVQKKAEDTSKPATEQKEVDFWGNPVPKKSN